MLLTEIDSNRVWIFDLCTNEIICHFIGESTSNIEAAILQQNSIYAIKCDNAEVLQYDIQRKRVVKTKKLPGAYRFVPHWAFGLVMRGGNFIYAFPQNGNMILKIDIDLQSIENSFSNSNFESGFDENGNAISEVLDAPVCLDDNIVYAFSTLENDWRVFNIKENTTLNFEIAEGMSGDVKKEIEDVFSDEFFKTVVNEGAFFSLERYITKVIESI